MARQAALKPSHAGILASAVSAHARVLGREVEQRMREERSAAQPSSHVGQVGERVDLALVVERVIETASQYGALRIVSMRDAANSLVVWKTGSGSSADMKPGAELKIRGTVKRHGEFRGEKQTELTRCETFAEWPAEPVRKPRAKKAKAPVVPRWSAGDAVSFSASPSNADNRCVHTGTIERICGKLAFVAHDGAESWVSLSYLHEAGAYEIRSSGRIGIAWTDDGRVTRGSSATATQGAPVQIAGREPHTPTHRFEPAQ